MNIKIFNPRSPLSEVNVNFKYYELLRERLKIKKVIGKNFVRFGKPNDGGYVMVDNFKTSGVAYSFGINNDVSWDSDMATRGYEIFMYDPRRLTRSQKITNASIFSKRVSSALKSKKNP